MKLIDPHKQFQTEDQCLDYMSNALIKYVPEPNFRPSDISGVTTRRQR